jgi:hypothetical protein
MQVAKVSTNDPTLRSEIDGYTFEDAELLVRRALSSNPNKITIARSRKRRIQNETLRKAPQNDHACHALAPSQDSVLVR